MMNLPVFFFSYKGADFSPSHFYHEFQFIYSFFFCHCIRNRLRSISWRVVWGTKDRRIKQRAQANEWKNEQLLKDVMLWVQEICMCVYSKHSVLGRGWWRPTKKSISIMINDQNSVYFLRYFSIWLRLLCRLARITIHSMQNNMQNILRSPWYANLHYIVCIFSVLPFSRLFSFSSEFFRRSFSFHFYFGFYIIFICIFFLFFHSLLLLLTSASCYLTTYIWSLDCWWKSNSAADDLVQIQKRIFDSIGRFVFTRIFGMCILCTLSTNKMK